MNGHGDSENQPAANERRLKFLYATQTGNAQDLAESLARHAARQHFQTQCLSLEDYKPVGIIAVCSDLGGLGRGNKCDIFREHNR
jgi:sulfite reductase alpha subunit-like flavoprotein